jgi:hypothetical protein
MSAEQTPILSGSIPAFEMFMMAWEQLGEKHPRLARWTDIGIEWAKKYYLKMDKTNAYVIAMCEFKFIIPSGNWTNAITNSSQSLSTDVVDSEELG